MTSILKFLLYVLQEIYNKLSEHTCALVHLHTPATPHSTPLPLLTLIIQQIIQISGWTELANLESRSCHLQM